MRWTHWLEIIGLATALAALFGIFGILMNVFLHGHYYDFTADIFIKEPQMYVLIIELILILISIPIMIYIGIKNIKNLAKITKNANKVEIIERKASRIFLNAMFIGFTMTLIIGLIIYIDELSYRDMQLKYQIKTMNHTIDDMSSTIEELKENFQEKNKIIEDLIIENKMLKNISS